MICVMRKGNKRRGRNKKAGKELGKVGESTLALHISFITFSITMRRLVTSLTTFDAGARLKMIF